MKVYIDLILLLNFGFDFLLLLSTSYLLKRNIKIRRVIIGAFFGSISTLLLFIPISSLSLFLFKIIISFLMIMITFSFKNWKYTVKNIIHLYLNSIILGGFLYLLNIQFSYKQVGLIFYHNGLSINFILLIVLSPLIIYLYVKQIKSLKLNLQHYHKIEFDLINHYQLNGFLDTGNQLKSIYSNKSIHIINKDIIQEKVPYFYEPIYTVNGNTKLKCFKVESIWVDNVEYQNVIFGISDEYFKIDADVILNSGLWEE